MAFLCFKPIGETPSTTEQSFAVLPVANSAARARALELKTQLNSHTKPVLVSRDSLVVNYECLDAADEEFFSGETVSNSPQGTARPHGDGQAHKMGSKRGFVKILSGRECYDVPGKGLQWSASRKMLQLLVNREEELSRTDKGLGALSHHTRLMERLERLNLDMLIMEGDGNCQFRSISNELFGTQDYHSQVRKKVIQHIRSHRAEYECFLGEDFSAYVSSMSRNCTWGDELTLRAACDAFGITMHVVTSDAQNWHLTYEPQQQELDVEIFLTYIAPIHYNAIRRKSSLRVLGKQLSDSFKRMSFRSRSSNGSGSISTIQEDIAVCVDEGGPRSGSHPSSPSATSAGLGGHPFRASPRTSGRMTPVAAVTG